MQQIHEQTHVCLCLCENMNTHDHTWILNLGEQHTKKFFLIDNDDNGGKNTWKIVKVSVSVSLSEVSDFTKPRHISRHLVHTPSLCLCSFCHCFEWQRRTRATTHTNMFWLAAAHTYGVYALRRKLWRSVCRQMDSGTKKIVLRRQDKYILKHAQTCTHTLPFYSIVTLWASTERENFEKDGDKRTMFTSMCTCMLSLLYSFEMWRVCVLALERHLR